MLKADNIDIRELYADVLRTTRDIRTLVRHANHSKAGQDLLEKQVRLLCGKHAINHILQEEKVIWQPDIDELYRPPNGDPFDKRTKINMADYCNTFFRIYKQEHGIPENHANPDCDLATGNLTSDLIQVFLQNELKYDVDMINWDKPNKAAIMNEFARRVYQPNCLGAIINVGGYHWTAISPNLNTCRRRTNDGRLRPFRYAYIDSVSDPVYRCTDSFPELFSLGLMQKIKQTIIVNFNDTSYPSVAVERTLARRRAPREAIPLEARPVIINVRLPATLKNAVNVNNNNTVPPKKPNKPNVTKRNNNQNSTATYKPPNNKTKKTNKTNTKNNNANSTYTYKP